MGTRKNPFQENVFILDGKMYRVEDYPNDELIREKKEKLFKKGTAYRFESSISSLLLPYHGVIDEPEQYDWNDAPVGIYFIKKRGDTVQRVVFPRNKEERDRYGLDQERSVMAAVTDAYHNDQFSDLFHVSSEAGRSTFLPPIRQDDDALNKFIKHLIRKKEAPFEPYGKRLEQLAVDKKHGMEGVNIKNNTRRALTLNTSMSSTKGVQYCNSWDIVLGMIAADRPNALHPMSEDGKIYCYFPMGESFKIDPNKIVVINPDIEQEILDCMSEEKEKEEEME